MKVDHRSYALFNYTQNPSENDSFELGDVVFCKERLEHRENPIGVILQCHGNDEYRTDMWGNCSYDPDAHNTLGRLATDKEIAQYRDLNKTKWKH